MRVGVIYAYNKYDNDLIDLSIAVDFKNHISFKFNLQL